MNSKINDAKRLVVSVLTAALSLGVCLVIPVLSISALAEEVSWERVDFGTPQEDRDPGCADEDNNTFSFFIRKVKENPKELLIGLDDGNVRLDRLALLGYENLQ